MSNPYDPYTPNQGQQPYGSEAGSGQGGYGGGYGGGGYGNPYGGGAPNPYGEAPRKTDAVSITGFVLSLTCCLSVVGAILGFIGLGRTKGGRRKGRWAAVSAAIIGVLGTLAFAGIIVVVVVAAKTVVTPDNAEAGQCVNVDTDDDDNVSMSKKECDEKHEAEIVYVGKAGEDASALESEAGRVCVERLDPEDAATLTDGGYRINAVINDPTDISTGDKFICYAEDGGGADLTERIL